jgi:2-methylcitrate dehydratase PrpD
MTYFDDEVRRDPAFERIARMLHVGAPPEIDRLYPRLRPARVKVTTARGVFTRQADEALGSRIVPLDDAGLKQKFDELTEPVLGAVRATELRERLWDVGSVPDVRPIVELAARIT